MTSVYIIRHAQSRGNDEGRFQGQTDQPLSEYGKKQAEMLSERCRDIKAARIYTSPLSRARETACAANKYLGLEMTELPELMEIHVGQWENLPFSEVDEKFPEERRVWREQHHMFQAPCGESMRQVYDRVVAALLRIASENPGEAVIAVSHGCAIRNMCAWALGGLEQNNWQDWVENTSITRIDIDEGGRPAIVFRNDFEHLAPLEKVVRNRA